MSAELLPLVIAMGTIIGYLFGYYIGAINATLKHNQRIGKKVSLTKVVKTQTKVFVDSAANTVSTIREMQQMPRPTSDGVHPTKSGHQVMRDAEREIEGLVEDVAKDAKKRGKTTKQMREDNLVSIAAEQHVAASAAAIASPTSRKAPNANAILSTAPPIRDLKDACVWALSVRELEDEKKRFYAQVILGTSLNVLHIADKLANIRGLMPNEHDVMVLDYAKSNGAMPREIRLMAEELSKHIKGGTGYLKGGNTTSQPYELVDSITDRAGMAIDPKWPDKVTITWLFTTLVGKVADREFQVTEHSERRSHADAGKPFPWDMVLIDMEPWQSNYQRTLSHVKVTEKEVRKGVLPTKPVAKKRTATTDSEEDTK